MNIVDLMNTSINDFSVIDTSQKLYVYTSHKCGSSGLESKSKEHSEVLEYAKVDERIQSINNINSTNKVLVIRNPVDRFISLYRFSLECGAWHNILHKDKVLTPLETIHAINSLNQGSGICQHFKPQMNNIQSILPPINTIITLDKLDELYKHLNIKPTKGWAACKEEDSKKYLNCLEDTSSELYKEFYAKYEKDITYLSPIFM